jgi:predicted O-methyltransferase YrrM
MIPINNPAITKYLEGLASKYDEPVLNAMEAYGHKRGFPIIDRLCGAMIHLLALSIGAKRIFELGSGFGYSAYWFAKAAGPKGKLWCTDGDPANRDLAERYLGKARLWNRVTFLVGDAVSSLKKTPGAFDIVYNDINKPGYPAAWEASKKRLRPGGLYICDNTLWSGRVAEKKVKEPDYFKGWTAAIKDHNRRVFADQNFDVTLIPLRDGVLVARRKT